jgi:hypothetical protein
LMLRVRTHREKEAFSSSIRSKGLKTWLMGRLPQLKVSKRSLFLSSPRIRGTRLRFKSLFSPRTREKLHCNRFSKIKSKFSFLKHGMEWGHYNRSETCWVIPLQTSKESTPKIVQIHSCRFKCNSRCLQPILGKTVLINMNKDHTLPLRLRVRCLPHQTSSKLHSWSNPSLLVSLK